LAAQPGEEIGGRMNTAAMDRRVAEFAAEYVSPVACPAFWLAQSGAKVVMADEDQRPKPAPGNDIPADRPWRIVSGGRLAQVIRRGRDAGR
jgi:hypothetical protein